MQDQTACSNVFSQSLANHGGISVGYIAAESCMFTASDLLVSFACTGKVRVVHLKDFVACATSPGSGLSFQNFGMLLLQYVLVTNLHNAENRFLVNFIQSEPVWPRRTGNTEAWVPITVQP